MEPAIRKSLSLEEYNQLEEQTSVRYEYHGGELYAMAGAATDVGSPKHGIIAGNAIDFKYAYARAKTMQVDDLSVPVVDLDDLILLKHAAVKGRSKARDSEDLSFLQKLKAALTKRGKS